MTVYTFFEARQNFASVIEQAKAQGEVLIKRKDGSMFTIRPVPQMESSLDIEGIDLGLSADEIVGDVREIRERQQDQTIFFSVGLLPNCYRVPVLAQCLREGFTITFIHQTREITLGTNRVDY